MRNRLANRVIWTTVGLLTVVVSGLGVIRPNLYEGLVADWIMPGVWTQDLVSLAAGALLVALAVRRERGGLVGRLMAFGLLIYVFYAYGIYTIERLYNWAYLAYAGIFSLSFYGLVYGGISLESESPSDLAVPKPVRNVSVGFLFLNALVFTGLWTSQLVGLIRAGEKIEFTYSIYILDLCFIMPAFVVVGIMALRERPFGLVAVPPLLVAGFGILFPLCVAELLKPLLYGMPMDGAAAGIFGTLSGVFLILAVVYLSNLESTRSEYHGE